MPTFGGVLLGYKMKAAKDDKSALKGVLGASKAQAVARGWSCPDRVPFLEPRGRCVVYLSGGFTGGTVRHTSETVAGIAELEAAMEAACR
jgi:hypothetical protein